MIDLDGVRSISPGLEPSAATILPGPNPEVTVSYVLKRPWLPGLPWSVVFRTDAARVDRAAHGAGGASSRGPLVGRRWRRSSPISRQAAIESQFRIRTPLNLSQHGVRVFPDPHVEPDALIPIRLRHPESGSARV